MSRLGGRAKALKGRIKPKLTPKNPDEVAAALLKGDISQEEASQLNDEFKKLGIPGKEKRK